MCRQFRSFGCGLELQTRALFVNSGERTLQDCMEEWQA
jgi:hypothetical protein